MRAPTPKRDERRRPRNSDGSYARAGEKDPHDRIEHYDPRDERFDVDGGFVPLGESDSIYEYDDWLIEDGEEIAVRSLTDWLRWFRTNRSHIGKPAAAVLGALVNHANALGEMHPGHARLMAMTRLSKTGVRTGVAQLVKVGLISAELPTPAQFYSDRPNRSTQYKLMASDALILALRGGLGEWHVARTDDGLSYRKGKEPVKG